MEEYTAEDYIALIEQGRRDKIGPDALKIIAEKFRELENTKNKLKTDFDFWTAATDFIEQKICSKEKLDKEFCEFVNTNKLTFNENQLFRAFLKEAFAFNLSFISVKNDCKQKEIKNEK